MSTSSAPIALTASTTLDERHSETLCTISKADGMAITLPKASGSGRNYTLMVITTITSNTTTIKVVDAVDVMAGFAVCAQDGGDTVVTFETAASSDTITFNGSTTGGIRGDQVVLTDVATGVWRVNVTMSGTGTEATPFSATVS